MTASEAAKSYSALSVRTDMAQLTHDQAIARVLAAFPTPSDGVQLANDMVFAQRLLAALTALDVIKLGEQEQPEAKQHKHKHGGNDERDLPGSKR